MKENMEKVNFKRDFKEGRGQWDQKRRGDYIDFWSPERTKIKVLKQWEDKTDFIHYNLGQKGKR